jgi:glycosyltransferase involved in cell wall biosynthesis
MIAPSTNWNGGTAEPEAEAAERVTRRGRGIPATNGSHRKAENRLNGVPLKPSVNGDGQKALAVFCYEQPGSEVGDAVAKTIKALGRRRTPVHLFCRQSFALEGPGIHVHPVGVSTEGELLEQVQEFTRRAGNAFLQCFPAGAAPATLMGYEWSTVPVLSLLRGIKNLDALLSLHSLERQRSDMTSELSKQIEEIELSGLREARLLWVQEPATAEVAKYWVPDCADRLVTARKPFPFHHFDTGLDAGQIKARYQVGPIDPTIVFVGDLDERYGPDLLVKAMPPILRNHPQARLVIVGDGTLLWPLRVYVRYLLLEHAVRLVGHLEGRPLQDLLQAADMVVVPSREPTPWWPILAAWAAHKPVVATHDAARGLMEHDKDSVLFYPNENSTVWGIERVLFDAEQGRSLGQRGYDKLEDRFGWNTVAAQLEELVGIAQAK